MMPGQEKMVMEFYQKNPSAVASLRGNVYEEKIINLIKSKAKPNKKDISKEEAEKILKNSNKLNDDNDRNPPKQKKTESKKTPVKTQKAKSKGSTKKKVSKK